MDLEINNFDFKTKWSCGSVYDSFCDNFWDMFSLGITCEGKLWQKLSQVVSRSSQESIIPARYCIHTILLKIHFIMDAPLAIFGIFPNSRKTLRQVQSREPLGCVLSLWHIVTFIFIFLYTHWVQSLEIWSKTNSLCQM